MTKALTIVTTGGATTGGATTGGVTIGGVLAGGLMRGSPQGVIAAAPGRCRGAWCRVLPAVIAVACLVAAADALGCPNCKDAVDTADPDGLNVARGYFYSILIMLAMPLTLVGSFGVYVWREMRRQERLAADSPVSAGLATDPRVGRFDTPLASPPT